MNLNYHICNKLHFICKLMKFAGPPVSTVSVNMLINRRRKGEASLSNASTVRGRRATQRLNSCSRLRSYRSNDLIRDSHSRARCVESALITHAQRTRCIRFHACEAHLTCLPTRLPAYLRARANLFLHATTRAATRHQVRTLSRTYT